MFKKYLIFFVCLTAATITNAQSTTEILHTTSLDSLKTKSKQLPKVKSETKPKASYVGLTFGRENAAPLFNNLYVQVDKSKQIKHNLILGGRFRWNLASNNNIYNHSISAPYKYNKAYTAGIYLRKDFLTIGNKFHVFGQVNLDHSRGRISNFSSINSTWNTQNYNRTSLSFDLGISYDVSKRVSLEFKSNNLLSVDHIRINNIYESTIRAGQGKNSFSQPISLGIIIKLGKL